ncbi:trypsin-like peptidase domain-containing protein [Hirsutella rhossiliensis]|uniref:Trypsin-like peptidase domain-containing protein n=1 Tax=Hirsutella rhossiliensis TaxID=111463 RepID=A0A9P8MPM0_9HYPO|nr:trypsin-like peptidase domain-containing protein [Hirsutella rhossiliensis]KAH0959117.1 trypsin-like peptidase domain-containing protein [Hirsutella rhossiliensis]
MPMDPTGEPSKWVCRLKSHFLSGTGFLVNMPLTRKYCIMTAGHNITRPGEGRANSVDVIFPNGLKLTAKAAELFVSNVYDTSPTLSHQHDSSYSDYALIVKNVDWEEADEATRMQGCSLSILPTRNTPPHTRGTVYGYSKGNELQTKTTSLFTSGFQPRYLEYTMETQEGVSGGPIFVSSGNGDVAIGIHNYNGRATRITLPVMLEMLSWISDYSIDRTFEDLDRRTVYLQSTGGLSPNIIARPGLGPNAFFKLVPVYIAKENFEAQDPVSKHEFVLLSQNTPVKADEYYFVTVVEGQGDRPYRDDLVEIVDLDPTNFVMATP